MKNEYQNDIICRIRRLRIEHGYTQERIANLLGISNGQIGNIESPKMAHKYTLSHIYQVCKEFHVPIEQIFLEDEDFEKDENLIALLVEKIIEYEQ